MSFPLEQCREALGRVTVDSGSAPSNPPYTYRFIGWIAENRFWLHRRTAYRNSFLACCFGTLEQQPDGSTAINGTLTLHVSTWILLGFFLLMGILTSFLRDYTTLKIFGGVYLVAVIVFSLDAWKLRGEVEAVFRRIPDFSMDELQSERMDTAPRQSLG